MIYVFRLSHRIERDKRMTTHVGLVARAFGARGMYYSGDRDEKMEESIRRVVEDWGGDFFVEYVRNWKSFLQDWTGPVVHLTMYGSNINNVQARMRKLDNALVVVGGEKVPGEVFKLADYNVAIGNQPHSEVAALAVFLDRYFQGEELDLEFPRANKVVIPSERGKVVINKSKNKKMADKN